MRYLLISLLAINLYFAAGLEFFLSLEKETVYVCEDIEAQLVVRNLSAEPQKMVKPTAWEDDGKGLKILIVAPSGDTLLDLIQVSFTVFDNIFLTLLPGESIIHPLPHIYSNFSLPLQNSTGKKYEGRPGIGLPPGTYRMKVRWRKICSNVVEFTIKKPEGKLAKLYDLYLEAFAKERDLKEIVKELEKNRSYLLEPYAPMIYNQYFWSLLPRKDKSVKEIIEAAKKAIENFPNSKFVNKWLFSGLCRYESKEGFENYLRYLNEKFPNTVVGKVAKQELEKQKEK